MVTLVVYIPETHLEEVKTALFNEGAGRYEGYDCCSWQVAGEGQFRALKGSNPFIGEEGTIERVKEYRVEMICAEELLPEVIAELKRAHPYEVPAFMVHENTAVSE